MVFVTVCRSILLFEGYNQQLELVKANEKELKKEQIPWCQIVFLIGGNKAYHYVSAPAFHDIPVLSSLKSAEGGNETADTVG